MPQTVIKDQTPLNCKNKFQNSAISWDFDPIERCLVAKQQHFWSAVWPGRVVVDLENVKIEV